MRIYVVDSGSRSSIQVVVESYSNSQYDVITNTHLYSPTNVVGLSHIRKYLKCKTYLKYWCYLHCQTKLHAWWNKCVHYAWPRLIVLRWGNKWIQSHLFLRHWAYKLYTFKMQLKYILSFSNTHNLIGLHAQKLGIFVYIIVSYATC